MNANVSRMQAEAAEAPQVVRRQLAANATAMRALGARLRERAPGVVVTCARGSSDHAATYAKYLIEARLRVLTGSAAPSLQSVYDKPVELRNAVFLAISQSGQSPDLVASAAGARDSGALVVVLCNTPQSPLTQVAHHVIPLCAGEERSVAATKSFIASLSALAHLVADWAGDGMLLGALHDLPGQLERARALDWQAALAPLRAAHNLFVIGRGHGLGVAQEAALKLKETCGLHAEAFSAAEVRHGPMALVRDGFPVLAFSQADETRASIESLSRDFSALGARVLLAGARCDGTTELDVVAAHPVIEPVLMIQTFYGFAARLARERGFDPDVPPHLRKVTATT